MQDSLGNLHLEEAIHGVWDVPNSEADKYNDLVQTEADIQSDPICSSAGCTQYKLPDDGPKYPMDYFVPNFGEDHSIMASKNNLKNTEKELGHKWEWKEYPKREAEYKVPDFGVDEEIKYAQEGIAWAQDSLGQKWTPTQDSNGYWNVPEAASADSYSYNGDSGFTDHLAGAVY